MKPSTKGKSLRSFLYLDNYKMYSISSQLFEGLTEFMMSSEDTKSVHSEEQKGPVDSGKLLAEIIEKNTNQTEKKFLHDFSYNLFENRLYEQGSILELNEVNISENILKIQNYSFVKISGNAIFNDMKIIVDTFTNFNKLGGAIGYIQSNPIVNSEIALLKKQLRGANKNVRVQIESELKKKEDEFESLLISKGLRGDEDYIDNLTYIFRYGFNEQFVLQIPLHTPSNELYLFSSPLKRESFKENEHLLISKYSRETEKKIQVFGIITQQITAESKAKIFEIYKNRLVSNQASNVKEGVMSLVNVLTALENHFSGKLDYEYVLDPIAVYIDL